MDAQDNRLLVFEPHRTFRSAPDLMTLSGERNPIKITTGIKHQRENLRAFVLAHKEYWIEQKYLLL
jgi:hypothetical protein